ncbi:MAG: LacI family DNA-binding transcriptional regulator [Fibrobacteres bacterium]|nr:LacI family DNA-binding transcriptional regulator [Fibrobacterota bacterium]
MAVTLKDIAEKAGVTTATVSMVINNKPNISEATKKKVLSIAQELNYYPNIIARGLATKRSNAIGVIVPNLASGFIMRIMEGVKNTLRNANYTVILFDTIGQGVDEFKLFQRVVYEGRVDGVIVITAGSTDEELSLFKKEKIPCVLVARQSDILDSIYVNNKTGSYDAVKYLISKGHRDIGVVTVNRKNLNIEERIEGYKEALLEAGIEYRQDLVFDVTNDSIVDGVHIANKILSGSRRPTAVFSPVGDMTAIGLIKEFKKRGLRVPEDMAVVGYDDLPAALVVEPALTTVRQPKLEMGDLAINLIIDKVEKRDEAIVRRELPAKFIIRESA